MTLSAWRFWIASLGAGRTRGRIGLAPCPGWGPSSGSAVRDFEQDMSAIARWGPHLVLTLLDHNEMWEYRVGLLPESLAVQGIRWQHLPMALQSVPDAHFEQRWAETSPNLREMLRSGGKLLMHCSDGLCRSGLLAARLLIELGCRPEDAVNRVQAARPGTLTAPEQRDYLMAVVGAAREVDGAGTAHPDSPPSASAAPQAALAAQVVHPLADEDSSAAWNEQRVLNPPMDLARYRRKG